MATFAAVCVFGPIPTDFYSRVAGIGVSAVLDGLPERSLWIDTGQSYPKSLEAGRVVSAAVSLTTYSLVGQSTADVYAVVEFDNGRLVREIAFSGDSDGWGQPEGAPRPWENDFHFALSMNELIDHLDEDWTEQEINQAKQAYEKRDLTLLPRLPSASYRQLITFAEKHGFDLKAGCHARYRKPGFFRRLFGGSQLSR